MALRKSTTAPAFEDDDDTVKNTAAATAAAPAQAQATEPVPSAADKVEATKAVAKAAATSVSTHVKGFSAALTDKEYALTLDQVKSLGFGTLPKMAADRAGFEMGEGKDKQEFGDWVDFQIFSYNRRWLLTTGEDTSDKEAGEYLRTSYDGKTVEDEVMSASEYIAYLKDQGYSKARIREYIDLWGFIRNSEKLGLAGDDEVEMIQLQLSPSSVKNFTGFQVKLGVKGAMTGKEASDTFRATIDRREWEGNKYAAIKFSTI